MLTQIFEMIPTVLSFHSHETLGRFLLTVEMDVWDNNEQSFVVVKVIHYLVCE